MVQKNSWLAEQFIRWSGAGRVLDDDACAAEAKSDPGSPAKGMRPGSEVGEHGKSAALLRPA